jgi:hypothetical protein
MILKKLKRVLNSLCKITLFLEFHAQLSLVHDKKGNMGDGCTDFTDFHGLVRIFLKKSVPIRENP